MRWIFLTLALLGSVPAFADKLLVANCKAGAGCTFELTDYESDLFETDGQQIGPGDTYVNGVDENGKPIQYVDRKTREEIDREWGGDGYTQIGLFNPHTQPTSGTWKATYGASTGNECYGIGNIGAFMRKRISPGLAGSGELTFGYPFHPSRLFPSSEMKWVKTGFDTYKGKLDFGSNALAGMKLYYTVQVLDAGRIQTFYTTEIKVPTKGTCIGKTPVSFALLKAAPMPDLPDEADDLLDISSTRQQEDDLLDVKSQGGKGDDLLDVKSQNGKDDLLDVKSGGNGDELLPVKSQNGRDDLLEVKSQKGKDDLLPVKSQKGKDDLLDVKSRGSKDDLLPVKSRKNGDGLLPVEGGKKPKPNVERIGPEVKRVE